MADGMTPLRHLAALPIIGVALLLWWLADRLAAISKVIGDSAHSVMGPE
jgi:hypothetical protein